MEGGEADSMQTGDFNAAAILTHWQDAHPFRFAQIRT